MKKILFIPLMVVFISCKNNSTENKATDELDLSVFKNRISYALGADMGANFSNFPAEIFNMFHKEKLADGFHKILIDENQNSEQCLDILEEFISNPFDVDTNLLNMGEVSVCYGLVIGDMLKKSLTSKQAIQEVDFDIAKIGFYQALNGEDTLMEATERQKLVADFNNDLNKRIGEEFMDEKKKEFPDNLHPEGFILIETAHGNGEKLDLSNEYMVAFTFTNTKNDTLYTTFNDNSLPENENAQLVTPDFFPDAWIKSAHEMEVGGTYIIYAPYELAYGETGLVSPNSQHYVIQPYSAIVIHSKVISQDEKNATIKKSGEKIIEDAKKSPNSIVDKSGFVLITLKEGDGKQVPVNGDVQAHYILTNSIGQELENSYKSTEQFQQPAPSFSLNRVVDGWKLALPKMREGGIYKLVLPYDLAYGERGSTKVRPYETLIFEIEILKTGESGVLVN